MMFGLSYSQYWDDEPEMLYYYGRRYQQQRKNAIYEQDTLAWEIGSYVSAAIGVNLSQAFSKRGASKAKYPEAPMLVESQSEYAQKKKQEREVARSYANFIAAAQAMGKLSNGTVL